MSRSVAAWRAYFRQSVDAIIVRMTLQSTVATQQRKNTALRKTHSNVRSFSTELGCRSDARLPSNSDQMADIVSCFVQPLGRRQTNKPAPTTSLNMESCGFSKSPNFFPAGY